MAERRAIASNIWDDDWFGNLDFFDQALWIGLFSRMADDQGRLLDNAALISSRVFPYKVIPAAEIEAVLVTFEQEEKIIRYEVGGKRFIQIVNWWEHQPMQYAVPSNYPPPPEWMDRYNTTYKGKRIIFNWQGRDTNTEGMNLWGILAGLPKVSTWTSYLGTLNPNPNPNPNPIKESPKGGENPAPPPAKTAAKPPARKRAPSPKKQVKSEEHRGKEIYQIAQAIAKVTGMDWEKNKGRLIRTANNFKPEDIPRILSDYGTGGLWYTCDWRGEKGESPTPEFICQTWGNLTPKASPGGGRKAEEPDFMDVFRSITHGGIS